MALRFAAAQARLNTSVQTHLNDVQALLDGVLVEGRFNSAYAQAFDGISTTATTITLASALCADVTQASTLEIADTAYRIRSVQPGGTGETTLLLERTT